MTYGILYHCFSNCTQSLGNNSLVVLGVVVVVVDDNNHDDDDDSNTENTSVTSNRIQNSTFLQYAGIN